MDLFQRARRGVGHCIFHERLIRARLADASLFIYCSAHLCVLSGGGSGIL